MHSPQHAPEASPSPAQVDTRLVERSDILPSKSVTAAAAASALSFGASHENEGEGASHCRSTANDGTERQPRNLLSGKSEVQ